MGQFAELRAAETETQRKAWTTSKLQGSPSSPPPFRVETIFKDAKFKQPVAMGNVPGTGLAFVIERTGKVVTFARDSTAAKQMPMLLGGEEIAGLTAIYGLAFHPEYPKKRECYLCYIVGPNKEEGTIVSRFQLKQLDPPIIDAASEQQLLRWPSGGHNGGCLKFGPDGLLYISTGDASPPSPADVRLTGQDISDLAASILRIDVDHRDGNLQYSVPKDNPFVKLQDARPEVWAYGLRNPWRMNFDPKTGDLWVGDVGWQLWEMVYRIQRGGNYGWSIQEGPQAVFPNARRGPSPIIPAVIALPRSDAASVTGGFVYRGKKFPELKGKYIYGDYVTGKIWALDAREKKKTDSDGEVGGGVSNLELCQSSLAIITFYESPEGEIAFLDYNKGTIHQLQRNDEVDRSESFPKKLSETGLFASTAQQLPADGVYPFEVNSSQWMDGAVAKYWVAIPGEQTIKLARPKNRVPTGWGEFPTDSILVKTIYLPQAANAAPRKIETQILHMAGRKWRANSGEWFGYSYLWNKEQTDAVLAPQEGAKIDLDPKWTDGKLDKWTVPSRGQCYQCHNPWAGYRLAFTQPQLERTVDYHGSKVPQLKQLKQLRLLETPKNETANDSSVASSSPQLSHLVNPSDESQSLSHRVRSYFHVNCAHCHRFGGGGTALIDLNFNIPLEATKLVGADVTQGALGLRESQIVRAGDPFRSALWMRMAKLGKGRMPHMGSNVVDEAGLQLTHDWITELGPPAPEKSLVDSLVLKLHRDGDLENTLPHLLQTSEGKLQAMWALATNQRFSNRREDTVRKAVADGDQLTRDLLERFLPLNERSRRLGQSVDLELVLQLKGNPAAGREMFMSDSTQCRNCHTVGKVGKQIGPDLSDIGKRQKRRAILENIVSPSRVIDDKYRTQVVETNNGKVYVGIIRSRNDSKLTLIDVKGKEIVLEANSVAATFPQAKSLMPELLFQGMTAQQLADLLAYLSSLRD
jgi:putative heme-binding domain-containing protein